MTLSTKTSLRLVLGAAAASPSCESRSRLGLLDLRDACPLLRDASEALLLVGLAVMHDSRVIGIESHADARLREEHLVDLLERATGCLDAEEVRQWDEARAYNGPDPKIVAADVVESDGRDHDDDEVAEPVACHTDGCRLVANTKRLDLGGIGPGYREDTQSEAIQVEEHESYGGSCHGILFLQQAAGNNGHADRTSGGREHDGPAAPYAIDVEVRRPRENSVLGKRD